MHSPLCTMPLQTPQLLAIEPGRPRGAIRYPMQGAMSTRAKKHGTSSETSIGQPKGITGRGGVPETGEVPRTSPMSDRRADDIVDRSPGQGGTFSGE